MAAPTTLALVGSCVYLLAAGSSFVASRTTYPASACIRHRVIWALIAGFFVLMAVSRTFLLEEGARTLAREFLRTQSLYMDRRALQTPITILGLTIGIPGLTALAFWASSVLPNRAEFSLRLAMTAALSLAGLVLLRIVSLHAFDAALGVLRLNWIIDMGATVTVGACALYYVSQLRSKRKAVGGFHP